jgi:hypothetical protein
VSQASSIESPARMKKYCGALNDPTELGRWRNVLDSFGLAHTPSSLSRALQTARECRHPDAQWLASLFPPGADASAEGILRTMLQRPDDPRAAYMAWLLGIKRPETLRPVAEGGYAPAQAYMSSVASGEAEELMWAEKASAGGDPCGLYRLGLCCDKGRGCAQDKERATELLLRAAELDNTPALFLLGSRMYSEHDWQRYAMWSRATLWAPHVRRLCDALIQLLPSFEAREKGRILHAAAPALRLTIEDAAAEVHGELRAEKWEKLQRVVALHDALLGCARQAIDCWSIVGRRRGVAKDVRVMIAKMVWEEPWRWGQREHDAPEGPLSLV